MAFSATAQVQHHNRGPGELLHPALQKGVEEFPVDLTAESFLWAFQRDSLLAEAKRAPLPGATTAKIATGLLAATRSLDVELRWQSLWALARIARYDPKLAAQLHQRLLGDGLLQGTDVVAEVACVAAGLAAHGDNKVLAALAAIATDPKEPERRRAFAFYGLGLAAQGDDSKITQFRVLAAVERALLRATEAPTQVRVAALHALALTRIDRAPKLQGPALALLEQAWTEKPSAEPIDFAANVPLAIAAVLPANDPAAERWRERLYWVAANGRSSSLRRSCALALGGLCRPWQDASSAGAKDGNMLRKLAQGAKDQQVRYYAWFAMGRAGGDQHREFLDGGIKRNFLIRPWALFGLAAFAASKSEPDQELVASLEQRFKRTRNRSLLESYRNAMRVIRREGPGDVATDFMERYGIPLPGIGGFGALCAALLATLADQNAATEDRQMAAMALGHLGDTAPRHWSAALARAIDYRSATPVLLGYPNGVLRLP